MSAKRQKKHVPPVRGDFSKLVTPYQATRLLRYAIRAHASPTSPMLWTWPPEVHDFNWRIAAIFWCGVWRVEHALQPLRKRWLKRKLR